MEDQIFDSNHPVETEKIEEPSPIVDENLVPKEKTVEELNFDLANQKEKKPEIPDEFKRRITCQYCGKQIRCVDEKFDSRIMKMHINRWHKEHKI